MIFQNRVSIENYEFVRKSKTMLKIGINEFYKNNVP